MQSQENIDWHQDIFDVLECQGIDLIAHVPDAGHAPLIRKCDARNDMDVVTLTTEEEGVAVCAGADLVREKAVVCMQSSGVGNIPNFLSFVNGGRFPILMMISNK